MNGTDSPNPPTPAPAPASSPTLIQKIELTGEEVLHVVQTFLPYVEAAVPAVAAASGPIGMGVGAAGVLLGLIAKIPTGPTFTVDDQAALAARIAPGQVLDFSSPDWQRPLVPPPPA